MTSEFRALASVDPNPLDPRSDSDSFLTSIVGSFENGRNRI